jgi:hypothetical protein
LATLACSGGAFVLSGREFIEAVMHLSGFITPSSTRAKAAVVVISLGLLSSMPVENASASVLWNNGTTTGSGGLCNNDTFGCGGGGLGWTVYNSFTLSNTDTVTGLTYDSQFLSGLASYVSTNWSIWSTNPYTSFASGPAYSGTLTGVNSADANSMTLTTITGLSVVLTAGTYWIGLSNNLSGSDDQSSYGAVSSLNTGTSTYQLLGDGERLNNPANQEAFTIDGTSGISATPLPAGLPLFAGGLGAMGLLGWRKKRTTAAFAA